MAWELTGRVWKFGDHVNTDVMLPGAVRRLPVAEQVPHLFSGIRDGWGEQVRPGDILVGGRNFGCGSGRPVPRALLHLGVQCVLAESVARMFMRNAINVGLPITPCPGVHALVAEGDTITVDLETGQVRNATRGGTAQGEAFPADSPPAEILRAGGLDALLRQRLAERS